MVTLIQIGVRETRQTVYWGIHFPICRWANCMAKQETEHCGSEYSGSRIFAQAEAVREALWLKKLENPLSVHSSIFNIARGEDNQGCTPLSEDKIYNQRTKHIDIRYQLVMENIRKRIVLVSYKPTPKMIADIMTKALSRSKFQHLRQKMGILI